MELPADFLSLGRGSVKGCDTRHICVNRNVFTSYTLVGEGEEHVYLGDSRTTNVLGKGSNSS